MDPRSETDVHAGGVLRPCRKDDLHAAKRVSARNT